MTDHVQEQVNKSLKLVGRVLGEDLDRDGAAERHLIGLVDRARAADADARAELELLAQDPADERLGALELGRCGRGSGHGRDEVPEAPEAPEAPEEVEAKGATITSVACSMASVSPVNARSLCFLPHLDLSTNTTNRVGRISTFRG